MNRPNILMVVVDCLRSDRIFGENRTCKTPNIDKIAQKGVCVPNMFVENSVTAPSFASIFTGCYSLAHGVTSLLGCRINPEMTTLADILMANDYNTYAEATGPLLPILGLDQGFDVYNFREQGDYYFTQWGENLVRRFKNREFKGPWFSMVHFWELHEPRQVRPDFDSDEFGDNTYDQAVSSLDEYLGRLFEAAGDDTVIILTGDHGERILENTQAETILPYFMKALDIPFLDNEEGSRMDEDVELLNARGQELHEVSAELAAHSNSKKGGISFFSRFALLFKFMKIGLTRARLRKRKPGESFWEMVKSRLNDLKIGFSVILGKSKDAQMQLLRTTLKQFHLQHGFHIYEYLQRVPFLISGLKTLPENKMVGSHVRSIDILPTLCQVLSLETADTGWHGKSFDDILLNGKSEQRPIYMEARGGAQAVHAFYIRGVRSNGYKLAYTPYHPEGPTELYNLDKDPEELENILDSNRELAKKLKEEGQAMAEMFSSFDGNCEISPKEQAAMEEKLKSLGYM